MKQHTIELNGKTLKPKITLGVIEDYCDEIGVTSGWQQTINESPRNMRLFIYHMTKHCGVTADELRDLSINQLTRAMAILNEGDEDGAETEGKKSRAEG